MKTKKMTALTLALILSISSFAKCNTNETRKKNLAIAGYTVLGVYSVDKVVESYSELIIFILYCLSPDDAIRLSRSCSNFHWRRENFFAIVHGITSFLKLSSYGFLTYFSIKNIIQEIRHKKKEGKKTLTLKKCPLHRIHTF